MIIISCQKPEYVIPNDETSLMEIFCTIEEKGRDRIFESIIRNDTVYLNIDYYYPIDSDNEVDLSRMLVRATIPVDSRIEPSLDGFTDLSKPFKFSVIAGNGDAKEYVIVANKKGNVDVFAAKLQYQDYLGVNQELDAIIVDNKINFSLVPGTIVNNPKLVYTLNRHASGSITNGASLNLNTPLPFTVNSAGGAKRDYSIQTVEAKKLPRGLRPGSAKILFAKKLKNDLGIMVDHLTGGIAASSDKLIINTRDQNSLQISGLTGEKLGSIELGDVRGGLRNFYTTSDKAGNILINNLVPNEGSVFNIWKIKSDGSGPELFISWNAGGSNFGRKVSVIGDISKDAIISAPMYGFASSNTFARWQVINGVVKSQTPEIVTAIGFSWSWNNADIIYTDPKNVNGEYFAIGYDGNKLTKLNGQTNSVITQLNALDGGNVCNAVDFVEFNNSKYVAFTHLNSFAWAGFDQVFMMEASGNLVGDVTTSSNLIWSSPKNVYGPIAIGGPANTNATADVLMIPSANGYFLYLYFMFTNGYVVGVQFDCVDL